MLKILTEKKLLTVVLGFLFLLFFGLSFFAQGTFDAGDGIRHYLVSRYSWKHPDLLLYSWGKPFFTLISSPFSQFGLIGVNFFNILCALISSLLCFKIAKRLNLNYSILVVFFLCFSPIYFPTMNSGLTEPLFGLILITGIYLMFENKYFLATLIISFLPFVRTEGNLILPFFFCVLLYRKKYFYIPMLAFGTIAYSFIGFLYYKDILWIKNQNPYTGSNADIYGKGELMHFLNNHNLIWGTALYSLFIFGCFAVVIKLFLSFKKANWAETKNSLLPEELFLVYGSFIVYFVAHSIFWWKGLAGSLGLIRVLAGIMPCSALICLRGFNFAMLPFFKRNKYIERIIIALCLFFVVYSPFKHDYFPYKLDNEQAVIKEAGDWFKASPYKDQKVYYLYPLLAHVLNVDSFDPENVGELWGLYPSIKAYGIDVVPDSTIIFWDGHFGPNECRIPLDTIMNDSRFELLKKFSPVVPFKVLGGYDFDVYAFIKLHAPKKIDTLSVDFFDLENNHPELLATESIIEKNAVSGKMICELSKTNEYSVTIKKMASMVPEKTIKFDFNCKLLDIDKNALDAVFVMSVEDETGKNISWEGKPLVSDTALDYRTWNTARVEFVASKNSIPPKAIIKFYIWNKALKTFYIDDMTLSFLGK
jgi:hypothetical protein